MKKTLLMSLMVSLVLLGTVTPVLAEESMEEMVKRCHSYAEEDQVTPDELEDYIKDCVESIRQDVDSVEPDGGTEENKD